MILDRAAEIARFRFEVPQIAPGPDAVTFFDVMDDMQHLCEVQILPGLLDSGWQSGEIVISFAAEQVPFGAAAEVTQYFQPFRIANEACEWVDF